MTLLEQLEEEELWMRRKLSIVIPSVIASSVFAIILLVAGAAILYKYLQVMMLMSILNHILNNNL